MSFGKNLKECRERFPFSQAELAEMVGISQVMISQYEKSIKLPNVITATRIAKILDTTCEDLVKDN